PRDPSPRRAHGAGRMRFAATVWAGVLGALYCVAIALSGVFVSEPTALGAAGPAAQAKAIGVFMIAYAGFFGFYAYFAVGDWVRRARRALSQRHGVSYWSARSSIGRQLFVAFAGLSLAPAALILAELGPLAPVRAAQGVTFDEAVLVDLCATAVAAAISFVFIRRTLAGPVGNLTAAVDRIAAGDLSQAAPVEDDTEIGRLTSRFNAMLQDLRDRERTRIAFERYVSPPVAAAILACNDADDARLPGELRLATVMFTDVEGFTGLSERITPGQLIEILNAYFETVSEPITAQGGLIANYIGDAVMAVFNTPVEDADHARKAAKAAVEIQARLQTATFAGGYRMPTRIGLHTGAVIAGSVGCADRLGYSVFGDTVNVAARLEAMNKPLGTRILVSEATAGLIDGDPTFQVKPLGPQAVRGRGSTINVFAITSRESADVVSIADRPRTSDQASG
ncbi:MAG: adenylate/guanylate cyclase domain-containing protein, partial [Pseudomonadota bacterium]